MWSAKMSYCSTCSGEVPKRKAGAALLCAATSGRQRTRFRRPPGPSRTSEAPDRQPLDTPDLQKWSEAEWDSFGDSWAQADQQQRSSGESPAGGVASSSQRQPRAVLDRQRRLAKAEASTPSTSSGQREYPRRTQHRPPRREEHDVQEKRSSDLWWQGEEDTSYDPSPRRSRDVDSGTTYQPRTAASRVSDHRERVKIMIRSNAEMQAAETRFQEEVADLTKGSMGAQRVLQDFIADMEGIVEQSSAAFDEVNLGTAFRIVAAAFEIVRPSASVLPAARDLVQRLLDLGLDLVPTFRIGAANQLLGALAKLSALGRASPLPLPGTQQAAAMRAVLERLARKLLRRIREPPTLSPRELALAIWGYSRMQEDPLGGELFDAAIRALEPQLDQTEFQSLSLVMLAAAALDHQLPESTLKAMAQQATLKMPQAAAQGVANLLWAFAKLTGASPLQGDLFRNGISRAQEISEELQVQNVVHIVWACGIVDYPLPAEALETFASVAVKKMDAALPATVAGLLVAVRKLEANPLDGKFILAALQQGDKMLSELNRQSICNILWAISGSELRLPAEMLHKLDGRWAEKSLALISDPADQEHWGQHLALILLAYAKLGLDGLQGRLYQEGLKLMEGRLHLLTAQNCSNVFLGAAILQRTGFPPNVLTQAVAKIALHGNVQEVCNTLWSLAVLGAVEQPVLESLLGRLQDVSAPQDISYQHASQVLMADLAYQVKNKRNSGSLLPRDWEAAIQECCLQSKTSVFSQFHEDVSATLEAMGIPHAIEFSSPNGLLTIDIVTRCGDGGPLAIEVDGDSHFTALPPYRPLGGTILRNRLIAANGFRGLGVPFYDWARLPTENDRLAYLTARLAKYGIAPVDDAALAIGRADPKEQIVA